MSERRFTETDKQIAANRELHYRRRVYPGLVQRGKMTQQQADREIALMEAIRDDYTKIVHGERLI